MSESVTEVEDVYDPFHRPTDIERVMGTTACVCPNSYLDYWIPLPGCPVHDEECTYCLGVGKLVQEPEDYNVCPECNGSGKQK